MDEPVDGPAAVAKKAEGDVMVEYDAFLRSNHVVVVSSETKAAETEPIATAEVEAQDEDEDEDMDYVDVEDEEYLDYLRANHPFMVDVVRAEKKARDKRQKIETAGKALPVVNLRAVRYEDYFDFEGSNAGPYEGLRLG
ncbi:hypothetical protein CONLIGDRAFT_634260 [Coniochaeta ligniaria NRRL 30616]|uniref:Uncharacterized protein n=1 Tax=Coniochaeta ligniaria NRRL 30616 TaxID=1408157 RepID=A0A1J7JJV3_9PEZI|nr:hypothetical protein CONLIGDRAFT_634260 [Coniochaeta ligniaria NRRL 30616]